MPSEQPAVGLGVLHQVGVGAGRDDPAVLEDDDVVRRADRRHPVGDDDHRLRTRRASHYLAQQVFVDAVQLRGRFVQEQNVTRGD